MDARIIDVARDVRDECRRDYVDLAVIPGWLPNDLRGSDECVPLSLQIVDSLLRDPEIVVGQFHARVFKLWDVAASEAYDRIQREWQAVNRLPHIGEICWFTENTFHLARGWS